MSAKTMVIQCVTETIEILGTVRSGESFPLAEALEATARAVRDGVNLNEPHNLPITQPLGPAVVKYQARQMMRRGNILAFDALLPKGEKINPLLVKTLREYADFLEADKKYDGSDAAFEPSDTRMRFQALHTSTGA